MTTSHFKPAGWIGVDLDGTLAVYGDWQGPDHIGDPIPEMVNRVKQWLAEGRDVRIFTARVSHDGTVPRLTDAIRARFAIEQWCISQFGRTLPITNLKDYAMIELWDDRAVAVEPNTGRQLNPSRRGL